MVQQVSQQFLENKYDGFFQQPDYQFIVDNPVMFCIPDTTSISFDETKALIWFTHPEKEMTSKLIGNKLNGILNAIRNFPRKADSRQIYIYLLLHR